MEQATLGHGPVSRLSVNHQKWVWANKMAVIPKWLVLLSNLMDESWKSSLCSHLDPVLYFLLLLFMADDLECES